MSILKILDKPFTLRSVLKQLPWLLSLLVAVYVYLVFSNTWGQKMGGSVYLTSPYLQKVPPQCIEIKVDPKTRGARSLISETNGVGSLLKESLLNPRTRTASIDSLINGDATCTGWAMLAGVHGHVGRDLNLFPASNSDSDYRIIYKDSSGNNIMTLTVEYDKPFRRDVTTNQPQTPKATQ
jgi:hypothetical protein